MGFDEASGTPITEEQTWYFYDNFEDIFPDSLSIDAFCSGLSEYWGFGGYTLENSTDSFYGFDIAPPSGDAPLRDILGYSGNNNYYLTVYFDGDQSGVPMYIQLAQFPGRVSLVVGTNHAVG